MGLTSGSCRRDPDHGEVRRAIDVERNVVIRRSRWTTLRLRDHEVESKRKVAKNVGGASSAVAASTHAACERFRRTDPLITGVTRRGLAKVVGFADDFGGIPDARWMRAMTFERLVRDSRFASQVATTAVGRLDLDRPTSVVTANARVSVDKTAELLAKAHDRAVSTGAATMLYGVAIPFVGFEGTDATDVKPDFAVVTADAHVPNASWLIIGDAKDYERVRSQIDDNRLMKGFLQVALGAESAAAWSRLPEGMSVHPYGVLAVPRNAFLQPEALIELLDDHRAEVRMRVAERRIEASVAELEDGVRLDEYVRHLRASFDPSSCGSCTLFSFCRQELRDSLDATDLLVEIGVPPAERVHVVGMVDGTGEIRTPSASTLAQLKATLHGIAQSTGQFRVDQAGRPGTVNVVVAKSDSAALGVYGIAAQRVTRKDDGPWEAFVFDDPQGAQTRRDIMRILGAQIRAVLKDQRLANSEEPDPIHLVVPDKPTADLLVSIADNLAGIELSRLRWSEDIAMGRPALTFNGEPAEVPAPLNDLERLAVSFLLEEDRARAFKLRAPIIDLRSTLARHLVPGGPAVSALRLDYLVAWTLEDQATGERHRRISDEIEMEIHTPGARLTNRRSNEIHAALTGDRKGEPRPARPAEYTSLVEDELAYKQGVLSAAIAALKTFPDSKLCEVYRAIEGDAQAVWRRRLSLHASDLVRFGRTYRFWRNALVPAIEADDKCDRQLLALTNPLSAFDAANDAGTRHLAHATVLSTEPLQLEVDSRRIGDGSRIVLLHANDVSCVEGADGGVTLQKGSFKINGLSIGPLTALTGQERNYAWAPDLAPKLSVGDRLVVADFSWFSDLKGNKALPVDRPKPDTISSPGVNCTETSYAEDPDGHSYCCRPHEAAEAEWSNVLAERRARGELNPEVWPPVVDEDAFEVAPAGAAIGDPTVEPAQPAPDHLTADDLD